jgi:predicted O-methyltransferase YrrM
MEYLLLVLLLVLLAGQALLLHKVRKVHLATFPLQDAAQETHSLFRQLQAYDSLMRIIDPPCPLPLLRGWAASPDLLLTLARHVTTKKPEAIIECSSGSSTVVMARCCQMNGHGHVYSLEHDAQFAALSRQWIADQGLESWATVIDAHLVQTAQNGQPWYDLSTLTPPDGGFDMLVIDGPPASGSPLARYPALPMLDAWLREGACVYLDDANRKAEIEILAKWQQAFPHYRQTTLDLDKGGALLCKDRQRGQPGSTTSAGQNYQNV